MHAHIPHARGGWGGLGRVFGLAAGLRNATGERCAAAHLVPQAGRAAPVLRSASGIACGCWYKSRMVARLHANSHLPMCHHLPLPVCVPAGSAWASDSIPEQPVWSATVNANLPRQQHAAQVSGAASSSSSKAGTPAGSVKLRLQISTNIPPGFGTAVDWDNPLLPSNGFACSNAAQAGYLSQRLEQDDGLDWEQQHGMPGNEAAAEVGCSSGETMRWRGDGSGALISALQKSVRRGCAASATRCVSCYRACLRSLITVGG